MPIPTPSKNEEQNKFISRCISTLAEEGDRYTNEQRTAICYSQWKKLKNKEDNMEHDSSPKVTNTGTSGVIAGQYEEVPPLKQDEKPKTYIEQLEDDLRNN